MSPVPTVEEVFGKESPWVTDPAPAVLTPPPNSKSYPCNNLYFATPAAAAIVADMLGGTVEKAYSNISPNSPFIQNQPNLMVRMPAIDGESVGALINAGYIATLFSYGFTSGYIAVCISAETGAPFAFKT